MMLSQAEHFFVRLLRGTVIFTAGLALLVATLALCFAIYAFIAPEPSVKMTQEIGRLRKSVSPKILISELFPGRTLQLAETLRTFLKEIIINFAHRPTMSYLMA